MREGTWGEAVRTLCGGNGPLVAHTQVAEELQEARVAGLHQPLQHEVDLRGRHFGHNRTEGRREAELGYRTL